MPPLAIAAALFSALIHASWNALLKGGGDRVADSGIVAGATLALAGVIILFAGNPAPAAWPYLAASGVVHVFYWGAVIKGYDLGDLSHVYTLSRGTAPLLVALGGALTAGEVPRATEAAGIALVSLGVFSVGASPNAPLRATLWALLTAALIASYSLIDALGARASHAPLSYIGWMMIATSAPLGLFALQRRGFEALAAHARRDGLRGVAAGIASASGFGIVLWAQTFAPIAQVTALRETSVVFAALLAWLTLKEKLGLRRWLGAATVACGAALISAG